jgi:uncharacterized protein (TIGR03000 family)
MFAQSYLRSIALAAAIALISPAALYAGGGGRGGGGGGGGGGRGGYGGGYGRGGYGGYGGYGRGYGGYGGYGRGYYGGYGRGFYGGYGFGYGGYGYGGFGFWPYYGFDYGWPDSGFGFPADYPYNPYVGGPSNGPALAAGSAASLTASRSFYPPDVETGPAPVESDRALVTVRLPADAALSFQGTQMPLTGAERVFRSPPLTPGKTYRYDVTARWTENGRPVEKNRSITVQAGQRSNLDLMIGD